MFSGKRGFPFGSSPVLFATSDGGTFFTPAKMLRRFPIQGTGSLCCVSDERSSYRLLILQLSRDSGLFMQGAASVQVAPPDGFCLQRIQLPVCSNGVVGVAQNKDASVVT